MKSNTHTIMTIDVLAILACKIREASNMIHVFNWIKALLFSAACWTETEQQRARGVCARTVKARPRAQAAVPAGLRD